MHTCVYVHARAAQKILDILKLEYKQNFDSYVKSYLRNDSRTVKYLVAPRVIRKKKEVSSKCTHEYALVGRNYNAFVSL